MGKTYRQERKEPNERKVSKATQSRNGILLGMILSGKTTKIMGDRRCKRENNEGNSWRNEEW